MQKINLGTHWYPKYPGVLLSENIYNDTAIINRYKQPKYVVIGADEESVTICEYLPITINENKEVLNLDYSGIRKDVIATSETKQEQFIKTLSIINFLEDFNLVKAIC